MLGAVVGVDKVRQVVFPSHLLLYIQCPQHLEKSVVKPFCGITLGMVGCRS